MTTGVALSVRGLTRRFGARVAVNNLHLQVEEGDVYGFLGPNGAGKTTAMRCMLGLIRRDAGTVSIFGEADPVRARSHVGAIIETPAFHDWMTGRQNLAQAAAYAGLTGKQVNQDIDRVLTRVGLRERGADRAGSYSLGMKQRLGIARALLGRPKLLMLDEPTNGLDPRGMREMRDLVRSLALHDRITVFVSSHLLGEVQAICNRVGIIHTGQLRAEGRVDRLLNQSAETQVIEVSAADMDKLKNAIEQCEGASLMGPGSHGRVVIQLTSLDAAGLNRAMAEQGLTLSALVPTDRNLEDVFLEVTQ